MNLPDYKEFFKDTPDPMNLLISTTRDIDIQFDTEDHTFLGAANLKLKDYDGEIHIFLKKGYDLIENYVPKEENKKGISKKAIERRKEKIEKELEINIKYDLIHKYKICPTCGEDLEVTKLKGPPKTFFNRKEYHPGQKLECKTHGVLYMLQPFEDIGNAMDV